jgi:hypothetical protein
MTRRLTITLTRALAVACLLSIGAAGEHAASTGTFVPAALFSVAQAQTIEEQGNERQAIEAQGIEVQGIEEQAPARRPLPREAGELQRINWGVVREEIRAQRMGRLSTQRLVDMPEIPRLEEATLPVLLPMSGEIMPRLFVTMRPNSYFASANLSDLTVEIRGSRAARRTDAAPEAVSRMMARRQTDTDPRDGYPISVETNEFGLDVFFSRFGASYNIAVICNNPSDTGRCRDPEYGRGLARSMGLVGPMRGE